jgi:hypothetical protein
VKDRGFVIVLGVKRGREIADPYTFLQSHSQKYKLFSYAAESLQKGNCVVVGI